MCYECTSHCADTDVTLIESITKKKLSCSGHWYFVSKIVLTVRKKCPSDKEKLLKFEAENLQNV